MLRERRAELGAGCLGRAACSLRAFARSCRKSRSKSALPPSALRAACGCPAPRAPRLRARARRSQPGERRRPRSAATTTSATTTSEVMASGMARSSLLRATRLRAHIDAWTAVRMRIRDPRAPDVFESDIHARYSSPAAPVTSERRLARGARRARPCRCVRSCVPPPPARLPDAVARGRRQRARCREHRPGAGRPTTRSFIWSARRIRIRPRPRSSSASTSLPSVRASPRRCAWNRASRLCQRRASGARDARVCRGPRRRARRRSPNAGLTATILRPWYVLGPGHRWPIALLPFYALAELLPSTRDTARRLGLVSVAQMVAALVQAVESPPRAGTATDRRSAGDPARTARVRRRCDWLPGTRRTARRSRSRRCDAGRTAPAQSVKPLRGSPSCAHVPSDGACGCGSTSASPPPARRRR